MSMRELLGQSTVAISISESPDMPALGLTDEHLRDAMAEIARHLLALGARLVYGGDLREGGFSELLFELVARHRRDTGEGDHRTGIIDFLAWPVHIQKGEADLNKFSADLEGIAELVCLALDGTALTPAERHDMAQTQPTEEEWARGLTTMRHTMRRVTDARIVLGGKVDQYRGIMPGIAEEALLSLQIRQPLYLLGGFGGCARDIAEALGFAVPLVGMPRATWPGQSEFARFTATDLNNGLSVEENATLARTPHIDQAVALILKGLLHLRGAR